MGENREGTPGISESPLSQYRTLRLLLFDSDNPHDSSTFLLTFNRKQAMK